MIQLSQISTTSIASLHITNNNLTLSTVALSLLIATSALVIIPSGVLMQRYGHKKVFYSATIIGCIGGIMCGVSLLGYGGFYLYCAGMIPQGLAYGNVHFYRHVAASEVSTKSFSPYAISIVVLGGVLAGVLGPQISEWTRYNIPDHAYSATYFVYAGIEVVHFCLLWFVSLAPHSESNILMDETARPIFSIILSSKFLLAAFSAAFTNLTMLALMTLTDIIVTSQISFNITVIVLQCHFLAMFLPSLFTGKIIAKFGSSAVISFGLALSVIGQIIFFMATLPFYFVSLIVVGIGWNFAFIGSTSLLSTLYTPSERLKVQSTNDFFVFGLGSFVTLTCGPILAKIGVNYMSFFLIVLLLIIYTAWLVNGMIHCFNRRNVGLVLEDVMN